MLWTSGKLENMPSSVQNVNHSSVYLLCTKKQDKKLIYQMHTAEKQKKVLEGQMWGYGGKILVKEQG